MRPTILKTILAISCVSLGLAVMQPAAAHDRGKMAVSFGQKVSKKFPAIKYPMPLADVSMRPSHCTNSDWCDTIRLDVSRDPKGKGELLIELGWHGPPELTSENICFMEFWESPDAPSPRFRQPCEPNAGGKIRLVPTRDSYWLVVRSFTSLNSEDYDLSLTYR